MKTFFNSMLTWSILLSTVVYFAGCDDDDDPGPQLTGESKTYMLSPVSDPAISGTVTFAERDDDQVLVTIELSGSQGTHPAHIHANSAAAGGGIILDFNPVTNGRSETVVDALNDGTTVTYDDFLSLDGYVNVHLSQDNLAVLVAQGDIGQNELTGDQETYTLTELDGSGASGTATFSKRQNGTTLVVLSLTGTTPAGTHPAHIHANDVATGGGIVVDLNPVNGDTGRSATSISALNDETAITYDELIGFNGHINVHMSPDNLATRIAQGNIGANAD